MHLDNSACNLASINLLKYLREDDSFDIEKYKKTIDDDYRTGNHRRASSYPTEKITRMPWTIASWGSATLI